MGVWLLAIIILSASAMILRSPGVVVIVEIIYNRCIVWCYKCLNQTAPLCLHASKEVEAVRMSRWCVLGCSVGAPV